jgi:probable F420-dependent oxidoreductase
MRLCVPLQSYHTEARANWRFLLDQARAADQAGVDRLLVSDHVVFGENLEAYSHPELGGWAGGKQPTSPDGHWLEPLTTLAAVSAVTSRVRLGTNIVLAALRRPVVLAKTTTTIDALSEGRLDLGVGVGWQREEYEAAGLDFDTRGRLLEETLDVCRAFWTQDVTSFAGAELRFERIHMMPKPVQPGGVPIWCSGTATRRVARRLARYGTHWIPWGPAETNLRTGIEQMRELLSSEGGEPTNLQVYGSLPVVVKDGHVDIDATISRVARLRSAGATEVVARRLPVPNDFDAAVEFLSTFVAAFRDAASA